MYNQSIVLQNWIAKTVCHVCDMRVKSHTGYETHVQRVNMRYESCRCMKTPYYFLKRFSRG